MRVRKTFNATTRPVIVRVCCAPTSVDASASDAATPNKVLRKGPPALGMGRTSLHWSRSEEGGKGRPEAATGNGVGTNPCRPAPSRADVDAKRSGLAIRSSHRACETEVGPIGDDVLSHQGRLIA